MNPFKYFKKRAAARQFVKLIRQYRGLGYDDAERFIGTTDQARRAVALRKLVANPDTFRGQLWARTGTVKPQELLQSLSAGTVPPAHQSLSLRRAYIAGSRRGERDTLLKDAMKQAQAKMANIPLETDRLPTAINITQLKKIKPVAKLPARLGGMQIVSRSGEFARARQRLLRDLHKMK